MAIYAPGKRDRRNRTRSNGKRNVMVVLSLTAMVDMFTVLVIFLLQNFKVDAIKLKQNVPLPTATAVKKLQPATVVVITQDKIYLDDVVVADFTVVKEQPSWVVEELKEGLKLALEKRKEELEEKNSSTLQSVIKPNDDRTPEEIEKEEAEKRREWGRITVQADKEIDFLTVKKILYTITDAGATMINFAVTAKPKEKKEDDEA